MAEKEKNKFQKKVDRANHLARYIITLGGYGVIISIVGILFFLYCKFLARIRDEMNDYQFHDHDQ